MHTHGTHMEHVYIQVYTYVRISACMHVYVWWSIHLYIYFVNAWHLCLWMCITKVWHTVSGVLHCAAVSCSIARTCCASTSVPVSQWLSLSRSLMPSAMDLPLELVLCRLLAGVTCTKQARTCSINNSIWMHVLCMYTCLCTCVYRGTCKHTRVSLCSYIYTLKYRQSATICGNTTVNQVITWFASNS